MQPLRAPHERMALAPSRLVQPQALGVLHTNATMILLALLLGSYEPACLQALAQSPPLGAACLSVEWTEFGWEPIEGPAMTREGPQDALRAWIGEVDARWQPPIPISRRQGRLLARVPRTGRKEDVMLMEVDIDEYRSLRSFMRQFLDPEISDARILTLRHAWSQMDCFEGWRHEPRIDEEGKKT